LGFAFFISIANDNFFVVYGAWMEQSFSLTVVALGMTTTVIGGQSCSERHSLLLWVTGSG
jgi:hypothetical protein